MRNDAGRMPEKDSSLSGIPRVRSHQLPTYLNFAESSFLSSGELIKMYMTDPC